MGNHRTPMARGRLGRQRKGGIPIAIQYATNLNTRNVTKARAGYAAMLAGTRNARVAFLGSSIERGVDETASPYNDQYARSITRAMADLFVASGVASGDNSWFGISGTSLADYKLRDKRITTGGTTATGSGVIQGGASLSMSSATATMSFTPVGNVDTAVISTLQNSAFNGATLNVKVDGVSTANIVQNTTNTIRRTVVPLGSLGAHTITIDWVSGANGLYGIECYDSTRKEVTFRNWAQSGGTSSQMVDNTGSPSAGRINQMNLDPVDLIIAGGELVNSWRNGTAVATVKTQAEALMDACKAAGTDYLFLVPPFDSGAAGNTANQQDYIDAVKASCIAKGLPYFDRRQATGWTSKAASDAAGYTVAGDAVHLTIAGQVAEAALLKNVVYAALGISAMAAPAYVQGKANLGGATSRSSLGVTLDAPAQSGSAILVSVGYANDTATVTSVTDDKGNTYTVLDTVRDTVTNYSWVTAWARVTNAPSTITANLSGSIGFVTVLADEVSNVTGMRAHAGAKTANPGAGTDAASSGNMTVTAGDFIYGSGVNVNSAGLAAGTGFTGRLSADNTFTTETKVAAGTTAAATFSPLGGGNILASAVALY